MDTLVITDNNFDKIFDVIIQNCKDDKSKKYYKCNGFKIKNNNYNSIMFQQCSKLYNLDNILFDTIENLCLRECNNIKLIHNLQHIKKLMCVGCLNLKNIDNMQNLELLNVQENINLKLLISNSTFPRIKKIICSNVKELTITNNVSTEIYCSL